MTTGKTIALTRSTFVGKVMSLLLNMLSRLVITFLPRSKHLIFRISVWHFWCFWTVVLEKTLESPLDCKVVQLVHPQGDQSWVHWKVWCWSWNSNTLATSCEELTHLKSPWCWERLRVGGEGDNRRWDGWMTSPTQWPWVWANSRSWWWTRRPSVLQFTGSQSWTQLSDWTELNWYT